MVAWRTVLCSCTAYGHGSLALALPPRSGANQVACQSGREPAAWQSSSSRMAKTGARGAAGLAAALGGCSEGVWTMQVVHYRPGNEPPVGTARHGYAPRRRMRFQAPSRTSARPKLPRGSNGPAWFRQFLVGDRWSANLGPVGPGAADWEHVAEREKFACEHERQTRARSRAKKSRRPSAGGGQVS